jgi:hypothetical protein
MTVAGIAIRSAVLGDVTELGRMAQEFLNELDAMPVAADASDIPEPDDVVLTPEIFMRDIFGAQPLAFVLVAEQGAKQSAISCTTSATGRPMRRRRFMSSIFSCVPLRASLERVGG